MSEPGAPRKPIDWEAIEREFRAGQLSVREIARRFSVTDTAIRLKAKRECWPRDLSERVREEVRSELVRSELRSESSREAIREAAVRGVEVVRQHRASAARGQRVVLGLFEELEATAAHLPDIQAEIAETRRGLGKINAEQAISVGNRAKAAQALASALTSLVAIERKAFSLDAEQEKDASPLGVVIVPAKAGSE